MEITELNNVFNNNSVNTDVSTLSSSVNLKALENAKIEELNSNSFTLDIENNFVRSNYANEMKDSLMQLATEQTTMQQITKQEDLLASIQNAVVELETSGDYTSTETKVQPKIAQAMDQYNAIAVNYNADFVQHQADTDSTAYFDGILGSKPLSPSDIIKAVDEKREDLSQYKQAVEQNIEKIETKELKTIGDEIAKVVAESPFKASDFGASTSDFSSANINSLAGSVAAAQANAVPLHAQKLLA